MSATAVTDNLIKASHQHGLTIIPWTVDDPKDMAAAIDRGLDGLITDLSLIHI